MEGDRRQEQITRSVGRYSSGQRGQTVNLLALPTEVRILSCPPLFFSCPPVFFRRFFLSIAVAGWVFSSAPAQAAPEAVPQEEYEVYSAALAQMGSFEGLPNPELFVIRPKTASAASLQMDKGVWARIFKQQFGIPADSAVIADFIQKNGEPAPLENRFSGLRAVFLDSAEEQVDWGLFREKHPKASGLTELSRVGFDRAKKKALVYVSVTLGSEVTSYSLFLVKGAGGWAIVHQTIRSLSPR